jgi:parallel beta-helix repeat protein
MKVKKLKLLSPLLIMAMVLFLVAGAIALPVSRLVVPQTALANPADWYVSTTGSDTEGDGSSGNPWGTIQYAVDSAGVSDGDTIIVRDGTYNENVDVNKRLTIQSENGAATTIVQTPDPDEDVFTVAADEVNISGFTVTGATGVGRAGIYLNPDTDHCNITNNIASGNDRGIYLSHASDNTISGNTLLDNNWAGIGLVQSSSNTINDNTASNTGFGMWLHSSSNNTISGNMINESSPYGIYLYECSSNTLNGNTASDNSDSGIALSLSSNNTIEGNTASENTDFGISMSNSSNNNTVSGNTASNNYYGIYLSGSSGNTLNGNTASDNYDGIHLESSSGNTIENNTVSNSAFAGIHLLPSSNNNTVADNTLQSNTWYSILLWSDSNENTVINNNVSDSHRGVCFGYSDENTVANNTISDCDYGIEFQQTSKDNTIENNTIDSGSIGVYIGVDSGDYSFNKILTNVISNNTQYGIYVPSWTNNTLVASNEISNNEHGVWIEGDNNQIIGNNIQNNTGSEDSGIHLTVLASENVIHFNNIVDNSPDGSDSYGVYNENTTETVDATLNWWGAASGPSGVGPGTGDAVSDNVTFEPWLGASVAGVIAQDITGAQTDVEISGPTGSDTTLTVNTSGDVTVIVALYSGNPGEPLPDKALGKYIDIYASDPDAIKWPVYVEISYTEDEVAAAGIDESTLGLYYWDGSANEFQRCSDTGVDTDSNIIWANVAADEAGGLAGTPFAPGGAAPGGLSIGVIVGIIVGAIVGAVLIFFAVRKWVWKS